MCGFAGFIGPPGQHAALERSASNMIRAIAHRGPDSSGLWSDESAGVALGHCRLAIVDLSPAGHQPMLSASGRYVIAFNGEIYNHVELRADLERANHAPNWRGTSDTEVLLAAIEALGVTEALKRSTGMFAFALWDRQTRSITLARDRLGEKPLYYGWSGRSFLFGSDVAALRRHADWHGEIDRGAMCLLLRHNCIPAPHSIYRGISKLMPGSILVLSPPAREPVIIRYWNAHDAASRGLQTPFGGSADDASTELERLLSQAIGRQMLADVPLGAFLSGGIDSSTVVALMQAQSARPVKTFTIGFETKGYNEAEHAKAVAHHLGADHTELYVSERDALGVVPNLPSMYAEPFSDSSQIPTFLVSQIARRSVTVSLSGDGGDELFSGYNRYDLAGRVWPRLARVPMPMRQLAGRALKAVNTATWDRLARVPATLAPGTFGGGRAGDRIHKAAGIIAEADCDAAYRMLISHWSDPARIVLDAEEPTSGDSAPAGSCTVRRMMYADLTGYLPDDILTKVDRASMAVSLEARVPMLDHALVEFALSLPMGVLRRDGQSKWPLRQVLARHLPRALFERPKMGFGVPLDSWLRGPLKDWAESLLDPSRLAQDGFLDPAPVRQAWSDHLGGKGNFSYKLWDVLMFQSWLDAQNGGSAGTTARP